MGIQSQKNTFHKNSFSLKNYWQDQIQAAGTGFTTLLKAPLKTIQAIILLAILLALMAGSWLIYNNIRAAAYSWESSPKVIVYLTTNTSEQRAKELQSQIEQRNDVTKAAYISPAEGMKDLAQQFNLGDLMAKLSSSNPLPAVIEVLPAAPDDSEVGVKKLTDDLTALPEVASLQLNVDALKRQYVSLAFWHKILMLSTALLVTALFLAMMNITQVIKINERFTTKVIFYNALFLGILAAIAASIFLMLLFVTFKTTWAALSGMSALPLNVGLHTICKLFFWGVLSALFSTWLVSYSLK